MSIMASFAPTSCKWTSATVVPCTLLSASAISLYTAFAFSLTFCGMSKPSIMLYISDMLVWVCPLSFIVTSNFDALIPLFVVVFRLTVTSHNNVFNLLIIYSLSFSLSVSSREAHSISPATPILHSKYKLFICYSWWFIILAMYAAPKPLSIFTTLTLLAQLLSIAKRAETPLTAHLKKSNLHHMSQRL